MSKIALCDLNHTTVGIHTEAMPLAIGLLGSYVKLHYKDKLDIHLFKFTDDFLGEINLWSPDIMGLSLYTWNTRLNLHMARIAVERFPQLKSIKSIIHTYMAISILIKYVLKRLV